MFDLDRWAEIWASIRSNKLRTLLSGVTVSLALFVFITLFGLSKGLQNGFEIEFFPPNVKAIEVYSGQTTKPYNGKKSGRVITLDDRDFRLLQDSLKEEAKIILPNLTKSTVARNFSEYGSYSILGTTPQQKTVSDHKMIKGRFIDNYDGSDLEKNIVIGRLVEKDLFKNESAVGKSLQLGNTLYKVVGVFSDEDGDDEERKIYLPLQTMQVIYGTQDIDDFTLIPNDDMSLDQISALATKAKNILKKAHDVSPEDSRGINAADPKEGLETTNSFFLIFTIIVFIIGIGSLVAGVVSIGNMMVFSVKERTKEIGIRKALGAKPGNIIGLILQESLLITFIFGFIGIASAMFVVSLIKDSLHKYLIYNPTVEPNQIFIAAFILFVSGLLAGFLPARKAAKIKPIDALNNN